MEHIIGSPVFGSSLGSVIGSLQTLSWSAYSAGLHTARILLIPDIARYKQSTTVYDRLSDLGSFSRQLKTNIHNAP